MSKDETNAANVNERLNEEERREQRPHLKPSDWTDAKKREAVAAVVAHYAREDYAKAKGPLEERIRLDAHYVARERVEEALGPSDNEDDRELVARIAGEVNEDARQEYLHQAKEDVAEHRAAQGTVETVDRLPKFALAIDDAVAMQACGACGRKTLVRVTRGDREGTEEMECTHCGATEPLPEADAKPSSDPDVVLVQSLQAAHDAAKLLATQHNSRTAAKALVSIESLLTLLEQPCDCDEEDTVRGEGASARDVLTLQRFTGKLDPLRVACPEARCLKPAGVACVDRDGVAWGGSHPARLDAAYEAKESKPRCKNCKHAWLDGHMGDGTCFYVEPGAPPGSMYEPEEAPLRCTNSDPEHVHDTVECSGCGSGEHCVGVCPTRGP